MVIFCDCGFENDAGSRASDALVYSRRRLRPTSTRATSSSRNPDSTLATPPNTEQEMPENEASEEQIEVCPLQADEQPINTTPTGAAMHRGPTSPTGEEVADSSLFLMVPDVLDCQICSNPLSVPVYQCENGHAACAACWFKMGITCATCRVPIGSKRCRAMENLLQSVMSRCGNVQHGCPEIVRYSEKFNHEETCIFSPRHPCPHTGCDYVGMSNQLYDHFSSSHSPCCNQFEFNMVIPMNLFRSQKNTFFQETNEKTLFILRNFFRPNGNIVTVVCVAPAFSTRVFKFDISASHFQRSVELRSSIVKNAPRDISVPPVGKSLRIPNDICVLGYYQMTLTIWSE